jgi:hypothetical protein
LIFRDLLDPVRQHWPANTDGYQKAEGFLHGSGANLLHDYRLKNFLSSVNRDSAFTDTRVIITSQYDSLEALKYAIAERDYGDKWTLNKERREKAMMILNDLTADAFWNPATGMETSIMREATRRMFKAWLAQDNHHVPRWLGQTHQHQGQNQLQQLTRHGFIEGMHRIGAWSRIWIRLLNACMDTEDFEAVDNQAKQYASRVREAHEELHAKTMLGNRFTNII